VVRAGPPVLVQAVRAPVVSHQRARLREDRAQVVRRPAVLVRVAPVALAA